MLTQTYEGPVRWVIVDDGEQPQETFFKREGWTLEFVRPAPFWQPGQNTQARNLLAGLEVISNDERVVVIEDDDAYAPSWLESADEMLTHADLVGEAYARYYNVKLRVGRQLHNTRHASLCSTAMRGEALRLFRIVCAKNLKFIDLELWRQHNTRLLSATHHVVGIKGLPGRSGIGMGHMSDFNGVMDPKGILLREWVGDAAASLLLK